MANDDPSGVRRDPELVPNPDVVNPHDEGRSDTDLSRREQRAEIGKYVSLVEFPATAEQLIAGAEANGAPDQVVKRLRGLRPGTTFDTARDVWLALDLEASERF
jgi:hypothetical protein